ncbi:MAG: hypothetical protein EBZ58_11990, partial [Bacteroidetes bacterium]|nr:hypothetical protein [Bacteroidota bacterium]
MFIFDPIKIKKMIKQTTKTKLIAIVFTFLALIFSNDIFTYSSNPPTGYTGGPSESNCTSCHSGTASSTGNISITGLPSAYAPGTNYSLSVNGASVATTSINGYELIVLNSGNNSTGTLTAGSTSSTTTATRVYLRHSSSSANTWSFNWTAPAQGTGTVTFYLCYVASNNSGGTSGDQTYVKSFTLTEQPSNMPTATISPSATAVCIGDTLTLTGGGINSPTGFSWTMAGGTPSIANTQVTKVVYATSGLKTISLTTSNANGTS